MSSIDNLSCPFVIGAPLIGVVLLAAIAGCIYLCARQKLLDFVTKVMSIFERATSQPRRLAFFVLAMFTIVETALAFRDVAIANLDLASSPPSDRCVPFFSSVQSFMIDNPSIAVYSYSGGVPSVRLCTNASAETVNASFPGYMYNPLDACGCSMKQITENCIAQDTNLTCDELMDIPPKPSGVIFHFGISTRCDSNCSFVFHEYHDLPDCPYKNVFALRKENSALRWFTLFYITLPCGLLICQCYILYRVSCKKPSEVLSEQLLDAFAWVLESPPGTVFSCCNKQEKELTLTNMWFTAITLQDILETTVLPVIAIYGCPLCQYPLQIVFISLKTLKIAAQTGLHVYNQLHAKHDAREELAVELSPSLPPLPNRDCQKTLLL